MWPPTHPGVRHVTSVAMSTRGCAPTRHREFTHGPWVNLPSGEEYCHPPPLAVIMVQFRTRTELCAILPLMSRFCSPRRLIPQMPAKA